MLVRLLYYLPTERMTRDEGITPEEYIARLEEENKNLKLIQETNEKQIQNDIKERDELREENKKLKEYNGELIENHKKDIAILCEENKKLKSDLAYERTMLDNVRAEYESLQDINKKLKEERDKYYAEWHLRHS